MKKKRKTILWMTLGEFIFFSILLVITIISLIAKIYAITCITTFMIVYGNFTALLSGSIGANERFAERNQSGTNKLGNYDGRVDEYLDRDYK